MPFKKKLRRAYLVWGEGLEDKALFKHFLRELNVYDRDDLYIHPGCADGGSARNVIDVASREIGNFNKRLVMLDRDEKTDKEVSDLTAYAKKRHVDIHFVTPCLEAVILHILSPSSRWKKRTAQECKHEVESKHITRKKRTDEYAYKKLTRAKILKAAKSDPELRRLIDYITGV